MPPIANWNPLLIRLYEKTTDFTKDTPFNEVAKTVGVTPHDISAWMRGTKLSQDKIQTIVNYMAKKAHPPSDIVYVISGETLTDSGHFRILTDIEL